MKKNEIRIFIGYDSREIPAYHTCVQSIIENASQPISITPLKLSQLKDVYYREDNKGTVEFSLTRFLVPYLSNYEGWSLFIDCDMLIKFDVSNIVDDLIKSNNMYELDSHFNSVYVCKHDYVSKATKKATGKNENYPRKNWSSVMLFNNNQCKTLTPEYVDTATPADLHRLVWAKEDIGSLPLEYNWLVGEYEQNENAKILHYTLGTPCFSEYKDCDHSKEWHETHQKIVKI
jgi:hypothetical protein